MSVITWGKPSIYVRDLSDANNNWKKLDTPKEDTTQLNPTKGDTTEAKEEGGGIVDSKTTKSTYELVYQEFIKKGLSQPFPTIDGLIEGNYAIAVQPEDAENPGCYIGKSTVSVEESYSSSDGALMQYTHKALVPEGDEVAKTTNKRVRPYIVSSVGASLQPRRLRERQTNTFLHSSILQVLQTHQRK